jgi:hypothetical protein
MGRLVRLSYMSGDCTYDAPSERENRATQGEERRFRLYSSSLADIECPVSCTNCASRYSRQQKQKRQKKEKTSGLQDGWQCNHGIKWNTIKKR